MLYMAVFDAREEVTLEEINREREEWVRKGRDRVFDGMCRSISRYEVAGSSPLKIFFVIDTDDAQALNVLSRHFGDLWYSVAYPVIHRGIVQALEEDSTIIGG
ncbi:MAG: hypothetical protein Kow0025_10370 [Thermodesulfovibrionales bacterium]